MIRRFAQIDETGLVLTVVVAESQKWCEENLGGTWVETFKDRSQRLNYASAGDTYDSELDAFIHQKPFDSWILNESTGDWEAPVAYPTDGESYQWDEQLQDWQLEQ